MSKLKCQINAKTNLNVKAQITHLEFGFWYVTFSFNPKTLESLNLYSHEEVCYEA